MNLRVFETFAGYGGASFGLSKAGVDYEVVGYSEVDKYAIKCYDLNHPDIKNFGDIRDIDPVDLPDFDLLTGGHPCQSFSIAGKRRGFDDMRGTLVFDVFRILKVKMPKYVLLENVLGILSSDNGNIFIRIMEELSGLGYVVDFRVFNSKDFGIPQNRERVFYFAIRKDVWLKDKNLYRQTILKV